MKRLKILLIAGIALCASMLYSCQSANQEKVSDATEETENQSKVYETGGWKITYEGLGIESSLKNVSEELGYADVSTSEVNKEANEGKEFCLIKLIFEKVDSSQEIDWTKLKLVDKEGNEYTRIDDSFLTDLSMKRLPGTILNFGVNEGWIAFEINESAEELSLIYPFEESELNIEIN